MRASLAPQRPPPLLLQLGARRRGGISVPPPLPIQPPAPRATKTVTRAGGFGGDSAPLGPDEDLGLPRGQRGGRDSASGAAGRQAPPPRAAKTTPRGRRGLPPKQPKATKQKQAPGPADFFAQQQREREQRSAAERADALYALAVREGRWPPSSSSSSSLSSSQPAAAQAQDDSSDDDDDDDDETKTNTTRRPMLFEEAAAALSQARASDRLRRKVAPRIANASSWETLHARVLPRDLAGLDERCTALLMAKLPRLRPGAEEAGLTTTAAPLSSPAAAEARRRFDLMVGAVAVATAPKLPGFADAALANVMAGMAAVAPAPDLRFLRPWAEAAVATTATPERWSRGREGADLLVAGAAAFGPALLSALLAAQDDEDDSEQRPSSSSSSSAVAVAEAAAAFAALFFERTAAAFASGDLELRHVAPAARAAEALLRCGSSPPGAEWWQAAFAAVVNGSGKGDEDNNATAAPRPSPRGSRANVQFAGALASLGAALDAASGLGLLDPQTAEAAREAAPLLEAELRARAEPSSSSSSSPLSPAGAAAALRGLSSIWRAASSLDAQSPEKAPSTDTVAAVADLWRRRGFRARAEAAATLCDELAAAARRRRPNSFVPDAEWRAAFEVAVASRMCPPGSSELAGAGGDEEEGDAALPQPLPRRLRRPRLLRRAAKAGDGATTSPDEAAASLALSSLALFSGWKHRPGPGWLAAFALSTRGSVASWPPRVLSTALASLGRALLGGGGDGNTASVSPLWALAVLKSLASRASSPVDDSDRRALVEALAALPPLLGSGNGGGGGAMATLQALAPSRLSPADVAALRSLGSDVADPKVDALLEMLG